MSNLGNNITLSGIGGIGTILTVLTWLINPTEISEYIINYPKVAISIIIFLLVTAIVLLLKILFDKSKDANKIDYEEGKGWKHSVLIIDDDESVLRLINDELHGQGFDIVTISKIEDYRLAAEFEIIISDMYDCSSGTTATSVLNTIKEKYPYKFILPMSHEPGMMGNNRLNVDSNVILKDNDFNYIGQILDKVYSFKEKLDKVNEHWENVNKFLIDSRKTEKQIEMVKLNYYRFVSKMQNGL